MYTDESQSDIYHNILQILTDADIRHYVHVLFASAVLFITALFATAEFTNYYLNYNHYLNLLYFAFTVIYGVLCIASIHSIPLTFSEQCQITHDCVFLIGSAILSIHTIVASREQRNTFRRLNQQQRRRRKRRKKNSPSSSRSSAESSLTEEDDVDVALWTVEIDHIQQHISVILPQLMLLSIATLICAYFCISKQYYAWIYVAGCLICRGPVVATRVAVVTAAMWACAHMESEYAISAHSVNHFDLVLFFMFSLYLHKCFMDTVSARKLFSLHRVHWQCLLSAAVIMNNCYAYMWWYTTQNSPPLELASWPYGVAMMQFMLCLVLILYELKQFALTSDSAALITSTPMSPAAVRASISVSDVCIPIVAPFMVAVFAAGFVNICFAPENAKVLYSLLVYKALYCFTYAVKQVLLIASDSL